MPLYAFSMPTFLVTFFSHVNTFNGFFFDLEEVLYDLFGLNYEEDETPARYKVIGL